MARAIRLAFIAMFVGGLSFGSAHYALAQTSDDAHALIAQGGGDAGDSSSIADPSDRSDLAQSSADDSSAAEVDSGSGASGGEGGAGGGDEGGSGSGDVVTHAPSNDDASGAALGSSFDSSDGSTVLRRLPVTGGASDSVGYMGGAFVLLGALLVGAKWRLNRRGSAAPDRLVWDAFGTPTN